MQEEKDAKVKNTLIAEIDALKKYYASLKEYVAGKEYDALEITATLQVFRDSLNHLTSHILTFYALKGQKTKITWQQFLANIENAINTMQSSTQPKHRSAIELALNMSQPNAQEVMDYLAKLKESLKA